MHKDFCVLLWVLLTGFMSPVGCRLSAGCLHPCLGHLNCANCVLLCESREGRNLCPVQAAKPGLFEKASLFFGVFVFCVLWNALSWRGATAAAVSEEPVNYFSQVTSCYPKVHGQLGGVSALPSACSSTCSCSLSVLMRPRSFFADTAGLGELWWG